jgi:hypothetical protein
MLKKIYWDTFWATFSQTHPVTLLVIYLSEGGLEHAAELLALQDSLVLGFVGGRTALKLVTAD